MSATLEQYIKSLENLLPEKKAEKKSRTRRKILKITAGTITTAIIGICTKPTIKVFVF